MAQISQDCTFIRYSLSEDEYNAGAILTPSTEQYIQNLLSMAAEEKINLAFTEANKQREAELAGAITTYRFLLQTSRELKELQASKIQSGNSGQMPDGDPTGHSVFR